MFFRNCPPAFRPHYSFFHPFFIYYLVFSQNRTVLLYHHLSILRASVSDFKVVVSISALYCSEITVVMKIIKHRYNELKTNIASNGALVL